MRRKVGRQRSPASHLTLKAFTLHAVGAGRLRREESRSQFVKLFPKAEHNVAGFGGITPASSLTYHVLPLIRRRADNQNVSQTLRSQIARGVVVHAILDEELILPHGFAAWAPTLGNVVTLGRKVGERQVIHLLNFSQANSLSWRDLNGTMPEPQTVESATVEIVTQEPVDRVWMASPDINGGAVRELAFEQTASGISVTLPSIKYWDMLVLEQD